MSKPKSSDRGRPRGLTDRVVWRKTGELREFPGNPRKHPDRQLAGLMKCIDRAWTNPILIDEEGTILAGHLRREAAKRLGMAEVPTLTITGLNAAEKQAVVIADNRLPEQAVWDFDLLRGHFKNLIELDFDVELSGFATGEVDLLIDSSTEPATTDPVDDLADLPAGPPVSQLGDVWELGRHRVVCGDALDPQIYERLMQGKLAEMMVSDPPFNVRINGHATGRGKVRHREFPMASGEMSAAQYGSFLQRSLGCAIRSSQDGAIHYVFMDWRHLPQLLDAAIPLYTEWKNLLVWNKHNAGLGTFYRSKHELIAVFKSGTKPHINNFGLGAKGRYRTNVLDYPGVNGLHPSRQGDLELHPTVKPLALIADLIRDCSRRNGIILDPFGGSGTAVLAAERTGRVARIIELDPLYIDVTIRRWQNTTGLPARHIETGLGFAELEAQRAAPSSTPNHSHSPHQIRRSDQK